MKFANARKLDRKSGVRWGERGAPVRFGVAIKNGDWDGVYENPHLITTRDTPNFLHAALDKAACAPFYKERRMKCAEPNQLHRKSGIWGTQGGSSDRPVPESLRGGGSSAILLPYP